MKINYRGQPVVTILTFIFLAVSLWMMLRFNLALSEATMPITAYQFMFGFLCLAIFFNLVSFIEFTTGYLIATFCLIVSWRIAATFNLSNIIIVLSVAFLLSLANFIYCCYANLKQPKQFIHALSTPEWQLTFLRLYISFDFIPHFTEKLFCGELVRAHAVDAFVNLGVPHPVFFVWLAGFCEIAAAIGIGFGLMMRLSSVLATVYLLIATYLGHHFLMGFIWAGPGGGWEFAVFWAILIFSFAITGAHSFSLDQQLEDRFKLPKFIKKLM